MSDHLDAWRRTAGADPTLPIASRKVVDVLLAHFRDGSGRAVLSERQIIDEADLLDSGPLKSLLSHGWVSRTAVTGGKSARYLPTVPLTAAASLAEIA